MKIRSLLHWFATLALTFGLSSLALAHTALTGSVPEKGATVSSPSVMMLTFGADVRLVKVTLTGSAGELDTGFSPVAAADAQFHVPMPFLQAGAYTVNWTAIGADGHSVSDSFGFTVDPNAPAAVMNHGAMEHAHDAGHDHEAAHEHEEAHDEHAHH